MRTYGKNYKAHPSTVTRVSYAEYKNRESTEWDVRLDLVNGFSSAKCLEHCVAHKDKFKFVFIGAEEIPDVPEPNIGYERSKKPQSEEIHIHVAVVMQKPCKREDVLQLLRGPRTIGKGNEYAVPRNPKFTYAGWIAHHSKLAFKLNPNGPLKLYEYGDLPMDSYDEDTCWKVIKILKKFGNDDMKERFKSYGEKIDALKRMRKELAAGLDEADTEEDKEPAVAPGWFIPEMEAKLGGKIIKIE